MAQAQRKPTNMSYFRLSVRDVSRSMRFYHDLFRMSARPAADYSGMELSCGPRPPETCRRFTLVLTTGQPQGMTPFGVEYFSFEVLTEEEVTRLYERAVSMGAGATMLRYNDGELHTFVDDPDGYRINIGATGCRRPQHPEEHPVCPRSTSLR